MLSEITCTLQVLSLPVFPILLDPMDLWTQFLGFDLPEEFPQEEQN